MEISLIRLMRKKTLGQFSKIMVERQETLGGQQRHRQTHTHGLTRRLPFLYLLCPLALPSTPLHLRLAATQLPPDAHTLAAPSLLLTQPDLTGERSWLSAAPPRSLFCSGPFSSCLISAASLLPSRLHLFARRRRPDLPPHHAPFV